MWDKNIIFWGKIHPWEGVDGVLEPEHVEGRVEEKVEHSSGVQVGVSHHLAREERLSGPRP